MKPLERRSKKALLKIIKGFEGFPDGYCGQTMLY